MALLQPAIPRNATASAAIAKIRVLPIIVLLLALLLCCFQPALPQRHGRFASTAQTCVRPTALWHTKKSRQYGSRRWHDSTHLWGHVGPGQDQPGRQKTTWRVVRGPRPRLQTNVTGFPRISCLYRRRRYNSEYSAEDQFDKVPFWEFTEEEGQFRRAWRQAAEFSEVDL